MLDGLDPQPGESVLDLYCGVGLFAASLAERVAPGGRVTAWSLTGWRSADARHNLGDLPASGSSGGGSTTCCARNGCAGRTSSCWTRPRSGAGKSVVSPLSRVRARRIAYVACDPAALARDVRWFGERGLRELARCESFDLFPMTHHVECVAMLEPTGRGRVTP